LPQELERAPRFGGDGCERAAHHRANDADGRDVAAREEEAGNGRARLEPRVAEARGRGLDAVDGAGEAPNFFNQPDAVADYDHWSKTAHWTLDEAIALSFGKAPEAAFCRPITVTSP
jgi:hypothetical protein